MVDVVLNHCVGFFLRGEPRSPNPDALVVDEDQFEGIHRGVAIDQDAHGPFLRHVHLVALKSHFPVVLIDTVVALIGIIGTIGSQLNFFHLMFLLLVGRVLV